MDLTHKYRYFSGGHITYPPSSMTYSGIVRRNSVRIAFLIYIFQLPWYYFWKNSECVLECPYKMKGLLIHRWLMVVLSREIIIIVRSIFGLKSSSLDCIKYFSKILPIRPRCLFQIRFSGTVFNDTLTF